MPTQSRSILDSIRLKTTLAVTITLVLILGGFAVIRYARQRDVLVRGAQSQVAITGDIIQASLERELLTQDSADLTSIIENVGEQPGVQSVYLLDGQGQVRALHRSAGTSGPAIGTELANSTLDLMVNPPPPNTTSFVTTPTGEQLMRRVNIILNQAQCNSCHEPQQRVLGALVSDFSTNDVNAALTADWQGSLASGVVTILFAIFAVNLLLNRIVLDRLAKFAPVLQGFGQGDLSLRLPPQSGDEIGQLAGSFNQMAASLQARERETRRLYSELAEKEAARAQLLQKVIAVQEEEQKRLARELHDDLAQSLTALSVTLQSALQTIPQEMQGIHRQLERLQALTLETMGGTSRWIQDLRPRMLDELGLEPAVRWYAESRLEDSVQVHLKATGLNQRLSPEVEITLFRIIQESIANIAKHARARSVQIRIDLYNPGPIVARIEDDGVGFIPSKYLHSNDGLAGMGLLGMRERVALLGGSLMIDSTPGRGTRIRAELPWKQTLQ